MNYNVQGSRILQGELSIPYTGIWYIEGLQIEPNDDFVLSEGDVKSFSFLDDDLIGTFVNVEFYDGTYRCNIVGGNNKIKQSVSSTNFYGVPVRTVLENITRQLEITISPTSNLALLEERLPRWDKVKGTGTEILEKLLQPYNAIWRILLDGSLWIGYEEYVDIASTGLDIAIIDKRSDMGYWQIYNEVSLIEPLYKIEEKQIKDVVYTLKGSDLRIKLLFFDPAHVITQKISNQNTDIIYSRKYRMRVLQQRVNGNVDVIPDPDNDLFKSGLSDVPICFPHPAMSATISNGDIAVLEFLNGSPTLPRIIAWERKSATTKPIARKDDSCGSLAWNPGTPGMGGTPPTLSYNGVPIVGSATITIQDGSLKLELA